MLIFETGG